MSTQKALANQSEISGQAGKWTKARAQILQRKENKETVSMTTQQEGASPPLPALSHGGVQNTQPYPSGGNDDYDNFLGGLINKSSKTLVVSFSHRSYLNRLIQNNKQVFNNKLAAVQPHTRRD